MKKSFIAVVIILSLVIVGCTDPTNQSNGGTNNSNTSENKYITVTETISSYVVWSADKTYYLSSTVRVANGGTLAIPAGTIVKFGTEGCLLVEEGGVLSANGSVGTPVYFTSAKDNSRGETIIAGSATAGDWEGIIINVDSTGSVFSNCVFCYGGKNLYAALKISGSASVDSCVFRDNTGGHPTRSDANDFATLDAHDAQSGTIITNNLFYRNLWPLAVFCGYNLASSNTFSFDEDGDATTPLVANTQQAIYMHYGDISNTVSWTETEVPICTFNNLIRITTNASLTISSGAVIKNSTTEFMVDENGVLNRTGVIFTSYRDDAHGGDTNGDGTVTTAKKGDWTGIEVFIDDRFEYISDANILYADEPK